MILQPTSEIRHQHNDITNVTVTQYNIANIEIQSPTSRYRLVDIEFWSVGIVSVVI